MVFTTAPWIGYVMSSVMMSPIWPLDISQSNWMTTLPSARALAASGAAVLNLFLTAFVLAFLGAGMRRPFLLVLAALYLLLFRKRAAAVVLQARGQRS